MCFQVSLQLTQVHLGKAKPCAAPCDRAVTRSASHHQPLGPQLGRLLVMRLLPHRPMGFEACPRRVLLGTMCGGRGPGKGVALPLLTCL